MTKPDNIAAQKLQDHTTAGTSAVTSDAIDMLGFEWVRLLTSFGTAAANNTVKAQQSSDDGSADAYSDLEGTSTTSGTSDEDASISIYRPTKRYIKFVVARGTSSTLETMWALKGGARKMPLTHGVSGTSAHESFATPSEGTA